MSYNREQIPGNWHEHDWDPKVSEPVRPDVVTSLEQLTPGTVVVGFSTYHVTGNENLVTWDTGNVVLVLDHETYRLDGPILNHELGPYVRVTVIGSDGKKKRREELDLYMHGLPLDDGRYPYRSRGLLVVQPRPYPESTPSLAVPGGYINGDNSGLWSTYPGRFAVLLTSQLSRFQPMTREDALAQAPADVLRARSLARWLLARFQGFGR